MSGAETWPMWTLTWAQHGRPFEIDFDCEETMRHCALDLAKRGADEITVMGPWDMTPDAEKLALFRARLDRILGMAHIEQVLREAAGGQA